MDGRVWRMDYVMLRIHSCCLEKVVGIELGNRPAALNFV